VKGNHTFKFGANIIRREVSMFRPIAGKGFFNLFGNGEGAGGTGYEASDILAGFVNDYQIGCQIGAQTGMFGTRSWEAGIFAQDDWRVSRRLTLNLGIRWDYLSKPTEVFGRQSNFDIVTGALIEAQGSGDALGQQNYHDFAPRVGFAYDLDNSGKTVVRGGYGIFYFLDRGGISNQLAQNEPFSGENQYSFSNGYRITLSGEGPMGNGNNGGLNWLQSTGSLPLGTQAINLTNPQNISVLADLPNNATSYMEQWNLQVQREVVRNIVLSVAYVGAAGHHLVDYYKRNNQLYDEPAGDRLYPNLGSVNVEEARGNSIYNALQTELQRRFSNGLQFTASYTYSRTIDDGGGAFGSGAQDFMNLALDRGLADQDVRGRFVLSGVYELPFGHGRHFGANIGKAADAVVGGWRLNAVLTVQSGLPFNLTDPGSPGGRPDVVGPLYMNPGNTQEYFNTNAIAIVPTIANNVMIGPGTLGRNVLIGPGMQTLDLGLSKTFSLTERWKLEFRAEAFNIANHPQYNNPGTDPTSLVANGGTFGVINSTLANTERQVQFAAKIFF
jgi:TonB dependent receptor